VEAVPRRPAAQVRLDGTGWTGLNGSGRWHVVDQEGYVLPEEAFAPAEALVRLVALGTASGGSLSVEAARNHPRVKLGLRVLAKLRRRGALWRQVREINVADESQIRFLLEGGTEVRCGAEPELDAQMPRVQSALKLIERQALAVAYVDVRFPEPVFAPRTL
jgi:hypothetical protein